MGDSSDSQRLYLQVDKISECVQEIRIVQAETKADIKHIHDRLDDHIRNPRKFDDCAELQAQVQKHLKESEDERLQAQKLSIIKKGVDYAQKAAIAAALYLGWSKTI